MSISTIMALLEYLGKEGPMCVCVCSTPLKKET